MREGDYYFPLKTEHFAFKKKKEEKHFNLSADHCGSDVHCEYTVCGHNASVEHETKSSGSQSGGWDIQRLKTSSKGYVLECSDHQHVWQS